MVPIIIVPGEPSLPQYTHSGIFILHLISVTFPDSRSSYRQTIIPEDLPMDEKTKVLISLGASVAVNCIPCFEHFLGKVEAVGLTPEEIQEAVEIADQVKNGARVTVMNRIRGIIGGDASSCAGQSEKTCCG